MDNFNKVSIEINSLIDNYIQNENRIYLQTMEDSWIKLIQKGKISFNDFSYLSAFDINFLKFKLRQYQITYMNIMESNDIESTKFLSNFIILLSIGIDQIQIGQLNENY